MCFRATARRNASDRAVTFRFALLTVYLALLSDLKSDCKAGFQHLSDSAYLLRGMLMAKGKAESRVSRLICLEQGHSSAFPEWGSMRANK